MTLKAFRQLPQFKLTVFVLGVALASIWTISLYLGQVVRTDMERLMGEQQYSTASIIATELNGELQDRVDVLTTVAGQLNTELMAKPAKLQAFLKERPSISIPFNGGLFITDIGGTALADYPVVSGRVGTNYIDRESISIPLKEGKTVIGRPNLGKTLKAPIFSIVVPVHDLNGSVIGAIAGTINLGLPNFLDKLAMGRYGTSGGYLLIAPQYRLIVTASDKRRVMESLPAVGVIPAMDRMLAGHEGTEIFVNAKGVEVMNSGSMIPVAGWRVVVSVPTTEVFSVVNNMRERVLIVSLIVALIATLIAAILTARLLKSQHAAELALYDPLTLLANRRLMDERWNQAQASSRRTGKYFAFMILDLDNFKSLNDKHGHSIGDLLLKEAARRLQSCVRDVDSVCRYGGDEFVVILGDLDTDQATAAAQASTVAEKIRALMAQPYLLETTHSGKSDVTVQHVSTVSIGVTLSLHDAFSQSDILKHADTALYQAKHAGRNAVRFYEARNPA